MRKFIVILVLFLGAALVILSFSELKIIVKTLQKANMWFLLLAMLLQISWFVISGSTFNSIYHLLGLKESIQKLTLLAVASSFVNVVAPSAGMGGVVVFIDDANRSGHSSGKVTVAGALYILFDYVAFLGVLTLGLVVLVRRNDLGLSEIIASIIMFAIAIGLALFLYLGARSADKLGKALAWMAHLINRIIHPFSHREYLNEGRAYTFAHEMAESLSSLPKRWQSLIYPLLWSIANKATMMAILIASFLSFDVPFSAGTIIGGFSISYLFLVVSPTPSGIGVVEGIMALALNSLNVEWSQAVVITLTYRAITFWVPLGVGALVFRSLHMKVEEK
jgi:glycosyltransferase 2 family protein